MVFIVAVIISVIFQIVWKKVSERDGTGWHQVQTHTVDRTHTFAHMCIENRRVENERKGTGMRAKATGERN